jgi:hypothetical protein
MKIFGFELKKSKKEQESDKVQKSPAVPNDHSGSLIIDQFMRNAADALQYSAMSEAELITRYREMSLYPHCDSAIDDIANEVLGPEEKEESISLDFILDNDLPANLKKRIIDEFKTTKQLLNFREDGYRIFKIWYVDGRINYHALITPGKEKEGIKELRYLDPRQIKKITEVHRSVEPNSGLEVVDRIEEYFIYNQMGLHGNLDLQTIPFYNASMPDIYSSYKFTPDSIIYCHSGIVDKYANMVYSHLHKAMRPLNQLKMMEDASVIYRITRAPERRIFKIDVGGLAHNRAVQYVQSMMNAFRNKLVYNQETGEAQTDKQFHSMQEDYWLPVKDGSNGSSIDTLPGGQNLGEIADIEYFQRKFYQALNVPIGRLDSQNNFNVGRVTEITRDEVKFYKFICRIRQQFSQLFLEILERQLILKNIVTPDEWETIKSQIYFIFSKDNYFGELKEQEIMISRMNALQVLDPYIGKYFSHQYIRDVVLCQSEKLQKTIDKQIKMEQDQYLEKAEDKSEIDLSTAEYQSLAIEPVPTEPGNFPENLIGNRNNLLDKEESKESEYDLRKDKDLAKEAREVESMLTLLESIDDIVIGNN